MKDPTTLYRIYNASGRLLYVGISRNWPERMKQHSREKPWWGEVSNLMGKSWFADTDWDQVLLRVIETNVPAYKAA